MAVDQATVKRIAHLARIKVGDEEVAHLEGELNDILKWIEQLSEVNVEGVEPMTSVQPLDLKRRVDEITDGGYPKDVVGNAPASEDNFFMVPTVVE